MLHVVALDDNSTKVLLALIGLLPSTVAAVLAYLLRRDVKTPSGARIGTLAEQTNHLAHANTALTLGIHDAVGAVTPPREAVDEKLNGDLHP